MPLFKRKPYVLRKPPKDLLRDEDVFQVRFTKEVFRDYKEYLSCMKLYRRRVWTCKVSGKSNLTYEEALVSERKATEKVQQFPKEFMGPVLRMVQSSALRIDELVDGIYKVFKERFVPGEEVIGVRDELLGACRILKVFDQGEDESPLYEVAWLDEDGKKTGTSQTVAENLRRKKQPFSRVLLKAFIRESASSGPSRNSARFVHDKLARKFKIPIPVTERPKVAAEKDSNRGSSSKKVEARVEAAELPNGLQGVRKRKRSEAGSVRKKSDVKRQHVERVIPQPIRYPIEDTQVKPAASDPPLSDRPVPATDFLVPVECTGNMLMVWDFCCLFGKALLLSPFSLEDFEKSLDYREGEAPLLLEMVHALLRAALTDPALRDEFLHKRKKRIEVTMANWKDDLCDFLELPSQQDEPSSVISMIRQGYFKQVKVSEKVNILQTLVNNCLNSSIRTQIDENIAEYQVLINQKREIEAEEVRRRKEEKELVKQQRTEQANGIGVGDGERGESLENGEIEDDEDEDAEEVTKDNHPTGWKVKGKRNSFGNHSPVNNGFSGKTEAKQPVSVSRSRQDQLKRKVEKKLAEEKEKERQRIEEQVKLQEKRKEQAEALAERKLQEQKVSERQKKLEQLEREMDKLYVLTMPLGKDRFHNRFWFFNREGRLFVESEDSSRWGYYAAKEELDALINSLNIKGIREKALHRQLEKYQVKISCALQKRSKELAQRYAVEEASVRRSERVRTAPRLTGFLAYVNKLRPS
ncbi:uncharacterized protein [Physcomitrium patens]|uniref:DDT domain-containing protein n=1 Tax=Physcomitrium patens TaxID=3218 RepID=A0A2K1L207_PHYPA|nr:DDT domain-containing protein DDB_G0282237-like [Physcomitrium patens]PNR60065.1 hypothetical protein PHYPA_002858 [Physcomitrium patens]|eukprot:XP_024363483.1 DDT domain-containing protein DDB_G0282237-like [Physcomitrella patens]